MRLRGIEFGQAFNASGARNFFGKDGWWFHRLYNWATWFVRLLGLNIGLTYKGCTLVTKTTTLNARDGFMPLKKNSTKPADRMPNCVVVKPMKQIVLNKVGLSGHGIVWLLKQGIWQAKTDPFVISIMAIGKTKIERLDEIGQIAERIANARNTFRAPFAIQINFSCPNVGHEQKNLVGEVSEALDILASILPGVPLVPKFNAILVVSVAIEIGKHRACDAIVMGNTIPWGALAERIDWKELFGSDISPLAGLGGDPGGGGLSGAPLLSIVCEWIVEARYAGFIKPIIACGGILHASDVRLVKQAGASAIEVGSASILRPWRVQSIIDEARRLFA